MSLVPVEHRLTQDLCLLYIVLLYFELVLPKTHGAIIVFYLFKFPVNFSMIYVNMHSNC